MDIGTFKKIFLKIKYEATVFLLLVLRALPQNLDISSDAYASLLSLDYSKLGLAPRVIWGSLMSPFFDEGEIGFREIKLFFIPFFIILLLLLALLIGKVIRGASEETRPAIIYLTALILAGPYAVAPFESTLFLPDRLLAGITIVGVMLMASKKLHFLMPLIIFAGMATHQMFAFTYLPLLVLLLLFELYRSNFKINQVFLTLTNFLIMLVCLVYFYFSYELLMKDVSFTDIVKYAVLNTDLNVRGDMILGYLGQDGQTLLYSMEFFSQEFKPALILYSKTFLFTLPLDIFFFITWKNYYRNSKKAYLKIFSLLLLFYPLYVLPLFPVSSEFYRLRAASVLSQFTLFFYLYFRKDEIMLAFTEKLSHVLRKRKLLTLIILAYFAMSYTTLRFTTQWSDFFHAFVAASR